MNSQFLFIALSIFTADNSLLRFLSHKVLLFWESALLTPCYNLAMADIGRPTTYSEEIITQSEAYLASCEDEELERGSDDVGVVCAGDGTPLYSVSKPAPLRVTVML